MSNLSLNNQNVSQPPRRSLQQFGYDKMTLLPVRCFTCNRVIADKQQTYETLLSNGYSIKDALNEMKIMSSCCRDKFMNPPKLPAGLVMERPENEIKELYNSFQLGNFENTTGNAYFNPKPLDPNKPRPVRTYYLTKPTMKMNDVQRRRIADIEKLTLEGPTIPTANFTTDLEVAFEELDLNMIPETKEAKNILEPSDLYYIRQQINAINLGSHPGIGYHKAKQEFGNIVDRLLINLVNFNNGYDKAKEEMIEKKLNPSIIDTIQNIFRNYTRDTRNTNNVVSNDPEFINLYNTLKQKYQGLDNTVYTNATLRYLGLGYNSGQQWRLDSNIINNIKRLGIDTEAFASPFNNTFSKYYSIYPEDVVFGSLGNFLSIQHSSNEKIYANPPFVPQILEKFVPIMAGINVAVIITPTWSDASWYAGLQKAGYLPHVFDNIKYSNYDTTFVPKFKTTIWTKGVNINDVMYGI